MRELKLPPCWVVFHKPWRGKKTRRYDTGLSRALLCQFLHPAPAQFMTFRNSFGSNYPRRFNVVFLLPFFYCRFGERSEIAGN